MSNDNDAIVQATDDLINLYRGMERSTLNLPLVSFMPLLISFWNILKFEFFLFVGIFLLIPVNLVIFIRNLFPGKRWRYRPFFLHHLYYAWRWITRGEAPTTPGIFVRPLFNLFVKGHFENRLRLLRTELFLHEGLPEATRAAVTARLDAALSRWSTPRFTTVFFSAFIPGVLSLPGWSKQLSELAGTVGIETGSINGLVSSSASSGNLLFIVLMTVGYLLAIPATAFLAKRGAFLGRSGGKVCFPGGQDGRGLYSQEEEILARAGLKARETAIDLWLLGAGLVFSVMMLALGWDRYLAWVQSMAVEPIDMQAFAPFLFWEYVVIFGLFFGLFFIALLRRKALGRW